MKEWILLTRKNKDGELTSVIVDSDEIFLFQMDKDGISVIYKDKDRQHSVWEKAKSFESVFDAMSWGYCK